MTTSTRFQAGEWVVDPEIDELSRSGESIKLEPRMMRLLVKLAESPGEVVSTNDLLDSVWNGVVVGPASVYQAISQLRKLLGDTGATPTYIATVPRKGYRLVAPVQRIDSESGAEHIASPPMPPPAPPPRRARLVVAAAAVAVLAILGVLALSFREKLPVAHAATPPAPTAAKANEALAVLPFKASYHDVNLGLTVSDLLRNRLAVTPDMVVIASHSVALLGEQDLDNSAIEAKLHAVYLLRGDTAQVGKNVRINATLVDVRGGSPLWSRSVTRPREELATLTNDIAREVASTLRITLPLPANNTTVEPDTYQLYVRGHELLESWKMPDIELAKVLFTRSVAEDPNFARGHLGLGLTLIQEANFKPWTNETFSAAKGALDRALQLDPSLGEVWMGRARYSTRKADDPEALYRKALHLAPNDIDSYWHFAAFLTDRARHGEARRMLERAIAIDPLMPSLYAQRAFASMMSGEEMGEQVRQFRQAIEFDPDSMPALQVVAAWRYILNAEFAEGARLGERALKLQPDHPEVRQLLVYMYLDMDDPAAASEVVGNEPADLPSKTAIALYQHDLARAAALSKGEAARSLWSSDMVDLTPLAEALRDEAITSGNYVTALDSMSAKNAASSSSRPVAPLGIGIIYAHTLLLAGQKDRGTQLAHDLLARLDAQAGKPQAAEPKGWPRAMLLAVLGDDAGALENLETEQRRNNFAQWWYIAEMDPLFARLRSNPRFQALATIARAHRTQQRALLEEMRGKGEILKRPAVK